MGGGAAGTHHRREAVPTSSRPIFWKSPRRHNCSFELSFWHLWPRAVLKEKKKKTKKKNPKVRWRRGICLLAKSRFRSPPARRKEPLPPRRAPQPWGGLPLGLCRVRTRREKLLENKRGDVLVARAEQKPQQEFHNLTCERDVGEVAGVRLAGTEPAPRSPWAEPWPRLGTRLHLSLCHPLCLYGPQDQTPLQPLPRLLSRAPPVSEGFARPSAI